MANYLDQSGLSLVLKSLNDVWMSNNGILKYSKVNKQSYPVLRSIKDSKLDSLYVDVTDIWTAIDNLNLATTGAHSFKYINVGDQNIEAEMVGDTLTLVGDNVISLTPDTTNDKITITHATSGVITDSSISKTVGAGGDNTFKIPVISVNKFGHVISATESEATVTIPTNKVLSFGLDDTDKLSYDGQNARKVYFKGSNNTSVTAIAADGVLTYNISSAYPTTFAWTNGTTSGPTGSLTGTDGFTAVAFGAIPSASSSQSGVVTTGSQTFAGSKTFSGQANFSNTSGAPFTVSSNTVVTNLNADQLDGHDSTYFAVKSEVSTDIANAVNNAISSTFKYKGVISKDSDLPANHKKGDVYFVKLSSGTAVIAGQTCENGDMFICNTDGTSANNAHWDIVQGNWSVVDGDTDLAWGTTKTLATVGGVTIDAKLPSASFFTSVKAADGNSINGSGNTLEFTDDNVINVAVSSNKLNISHAQVGANKSVGDTSAQTPAFGGTFKVTSSTVDNYGHVTSTNEHTVTIPSTAATTSTNGLMTTTQVTKLNGVASGATSDAALTNTNIVAAFSSGMGLTVTV